MQVLVRMKNRDLDCGCQGIHAEPFILPCSNLQVLGFMAYGYGSDADVALL